MEKTRKTLFYPLFYIFMSGISMLFAPQLALKMMFSNGTYEDAFVMMTGLILLGMWAFLFQVVRLRVEKLYSTAIYARIMFLAVYLWLYSLTSDPFFLAVFAVVAPGLIATSIAYLKESKA